MVRSIVFCIVARRHRRPRRRHRLAHAARQPGPTARPPGLVARRVGDAGRRRDDGVDLDRRLAARPAQLVPRQLGIEDAQGHNWLAEPLSFFIVAAVIVIWMSVPFVALSIYAGLTQIAPEVLEAAELDGATGWQRVRHIILPLIAPVISIVLLLQLIWDLRVFTQIKLLQDAGGVANETHLLGTYIYTLGTGTGDFGMASAVCILMLVLTMVISSYYVRSLMKEDVLMRRRTLRPRACSRTLGPRVSARCGPSRSTGCSTPPCCPTSCCSRTTPTFVPSAGSLDNLRAVAR